MAIEKGLSPVTFPADADLSARQFRAVNLAADGQAKAAGAGQYVLGILQNKPAAVGRAAAVETKAGAVTKVSASTTAGVAIAAGTALVSGANGIVLAASTGGTAYVFGRAMEALSTGLTGIISAEITHEGPSSTA